MIKVKTKYKKLALGGIDPVSLGTSAISAGLQIYSAMKAKADAKNAEQFAENAQRQQTMQTDKNFLRDFNTTGGIKDFYRTGGVHKLNTRKGLIPINNNTFIANGNTHKKGGIKIGDAEIEDQEVVKFSNGNMNVLSNAKDVFGYSPAKRALNDINSGINPDLAFDNQMNKQESMKSGKTKTRKFIRGGEDIPPYNYGQAPDRNPFSRFPTDNEIDEVGVYAQNGLKKLKPITPFVKNNPIYTPYGRDKSMDSNEVELLSNNNRAVLSAPYGNDKLLPKRPYTIPNVYDKLVFPADKIGNVDKPVKDFSPFIDNVGNLAATLLSPGASKPILDKNIQLQTDVNVDPQLQDVKNAERSQKTWTDRNIADSNVTAGINQSASNNANVNRNRIRSEELNAERAIQNQEMSINSTINSNNNNKTNQYMNDVRDVSVNKISELSQNISNLGDDITKMRNRKEALNFRNKELNISMLSQKNPEVVKNAILMDPDTWRDIILPNYDKLISAESNLDPNLQRAIITSFKDDRSRQIKEEELKKKSRIK